MPNKFYLNSCYQALSRLSYKALSSCIKKPSHYWDSFEQNIYVYKPWSISL